MDENQANDFQSKSGDFRIKSDDFQNKSNDFQSLEASFRAGATGRGRGGVYISYIYIYIYIYWVSLLHALRPKGLGGFSCNFENIYLLEFKSFPIDQQISK